MTNPSIDAERGVPGLRLALEAETRVGDLWHSLDDGWLQCSACSLQCRIKPGSAGVCNVRFNRDGRLHVPWGYVSAVQVEPIEKKPFFHVDPGARAYSFGMFGCDMHCSYCQNWVVSQTLRDPASVSPVMKMGPEKLIQEAIAAGSRIVVSTYNEPLISAEWATTVFKEARAKGLRTAFVSNGNATPRALEYLEPWIDAYKVDLKCFDDRAYRQLGGRLQPVLETIASLYKMKVWIEVVTLLIPGFNDSELQLQEAAAFLAGISPDIPWHLTAYHRDYQMHDRPDTKAHDLVRAVTLARAAGLRYVYAGNLAGRVGELENTRCGACDALLISRRGFRTLESRIVVRANASGSAIGSCPRCEHPIPGRWNAPDIGSSKRPPIGVEMPQKPAVD